MDARLMQTMLAQRAAASQAVAGALAPKNSASGVKSAASTATGATTTSAADPNATITSNDFLTLLVSELKNQDPTQPTDPNAYISQLVGVNSLEQLIQINSGITSLDTAVPASGTKTPSVTAGLQAANMQPASAPAVSSHIQKQVPGAAAQ